MPVSPQDLSALADQVETNIKTIDPQAAANVKQELLGLKGANGEAPTVADVRNFESKFVGVKKALENASQLAKNNFGRSTADIAKGTLPIAGAVSGGGLPSAAGAGIGMLASHPAADAATANVLDKASTVLGNKTLTQKILPILARTGAIGALNLPGMSQNTPPSSTPLNTQQAQNTQGAPNMQPSGQMNPLGAILQAGILDPMQYGSMLNTLEPFIQKEQVAQNAMSQLAPLYNSAGGGQGAIGGLLGNILGMVPGTNQYNYMQARNMAARAGAPFGISGGNIPSFMQTPQGAQSMIGADNTMLSNLGL